MDGRGRGQLTAIVRLDWRKRLAYGGRKERPPAFLACVP